MNKPKQKPMPILRTAVLAVISLVLGVNIYLWNAGSLVGDQMPMPFGYGAAVVLSGSMEPELHIDDVILVHETQDYRVGDVVVYQSQGSLVVHRVAAVSGSTLTTRGNANNTDDAPIEISAVKGEVISVLPGMGGLIRTLKSPYAFLGLLAVAIIGLELSFRREKQKGSEDLDKIKEEIRRLKAQQEENQ